MTPPREFIDYLQDIADTIEKVENFTKGINYEQFVADEKTIFAVVRAFEIIGEATKNIPAALKVDYPNVPWKEMAGFRDKLTHEYFGVNLDVVWRTLQEDIPLLKPNILGVLAEAKKG